MAPQTESTEIQEAWRALDSAHGAAVGGWKTIRICTGGPCQIRAGRRFPGNEEALLVGFPKIRIPKADPLPAGRGFLVSEETLGPEGGNQLWIALCRQPSGSLELFGVMAEDVSSLLQASAADMEAEILRTLLARIRAWQEFMQRSASSVLSSESEIGLFGELVILKAMITTGMSLHLAIESWEGPADGLHDFSVGSGAIEVKSTVAGGGFPARIGSLDQLDDALVKPLFLAGVRLSIAENGRNLVQIIEEIRELLAGEPHTRREFDSRLLRGGYADSAALHYTRRFYHCSTKILEVTESFPRLIKGNVPHAVTGAQYEINLNHVSAHELGLPDALKSLGAIS